MICKVGVCSVEVIIGYHFHLVRFQIISVGFGDRSFFALVLVCTNDANTGKSQMVVKTEGDLYITKNRLSE